MNSNSTKQPKCVKEAARQLETDEYEERFNEKLRKLVKDQPRGDSQD